MPALHNLKRERFARAVSAGAPLIDAYEAAGYVRRRGNPGRLARRPEVAARIEQLRSTLAPGDLAHIEYLRARIEEAAAKVLAVIRPTAAGTEEPTHCRDRMSRLANDLRRIAEALDRQGGGPPGAVSG
jgi:hypothetical protein